MAKKTVKRPAKPAKKSTTKKRMESFDFATHNKKVAKKRGSEWKAKLKQGKLKNASKVTAVRKFRVAKGMSQTELLKTLSIKSITTLVKIERGEQTASTQVAREIARTLSLPVHTLFNKNETTKRYTAKSVM